MAHGAGLETRRLFAVLDGDLSLEACQGGAVRRSKVRKRAVALVHIVEIQKCLEFALEGVEVEVAGDVGALAVVLERQQRAEHGHAIVSGGDAEHERIVPELRQLWDELVYVVDAPYAGVVGPLTTVLQLSIPVAGIGAFGEIVVAADLEILAKSFAHPQGAIARPIRLYCGEAVAPQLPKELLLARLEPPRPPCKLRFEQLLLQQHTGARDAQQVATP